jgi:gliding motility-associated-like protein
VPNAFTPNFDGKNDYLYPLNAYKADNLVFQVYNRFGQLVFETKDWTRKWDGTINGRQQQTGTFVWVLKYIDHDTQQPVLKKGTTVLIR